MENIKISKEILTKLTKLQTDIEYIKSRMELGKSEELEMEIKKWENASAEDSSDFFNRRNL